MMEDMWIIRVDSMGGQRKTYFFFSKEEAEANHSLMVESIGIEYRWVGEITIPLVHDPFAHPHSA